MASVARFGQFLVRGESRLKIFSVRGLLKILGRSEERRGERRPGFFASSSGLVLAKRLGELDVFFGLTLDRFPRGLRRFELFADGGGQRFIPFGELFHRVFNGS